MINNEDKNKTQNLVGRLSCERQEENDSINDFDIINDRCPKLNI